LLWQSKLNGAIPVPLGFLKWGFSEVATYDPSFGGFPKEPNLSAWRGQVKWDSYPPDGPIDLSGIGQYPSWNGLFLTYLRK
jgi:hypothetical protein